VTAIKVVPNRPFPPLGVMGRRGGAARSRLASAALGGLWLLSGWALPAQVEPRPASRDPFAPPTIQPVEDYTDLWRRGSYREALAMLEAQISSFSGRVPYTLLQNRAELKLEIGWVDSAISDMEKLVSAIPEPVYTLRLALMYQERGRKTDYQASLRRALDQWERSRQYGFYAENRVAVARIAELIGQNPKTILGTLFASLIESRPGFVPAYVGAGDLAYRKFDYALAADYYQKALALEPENLDARAGLAECYWKSSDPRLEAELEAIVKVNPRHPRARAIQVELLLDVGRAEQALEQIEEALEVNPVSLRFRSLESAALFLLDRKAEMEQVHEEVLAFNPYASEVFRTTGRIASRHYRFEEAARFQRRALEVEPEDIEARAFYGFDLLRLGREDEGRRELELAFEADKYNVHVFNMLKVLDSLIRYEARERGPFRLLVPRSEAPILAEDALALLERAYARYTEKYRIEPETPIHVQIFDNHDDFMVRSIGLPGSIGYMGICFGRLITMDSPSARSKWTMNWRSVLWHEFVHVITLQKTRNRMPRWLSEGISVYEETQEARAWGQRMDVQYKALIQEGTLPGLSNLEAYFTQAKSPLHLMFGYFLAGEFVQFYVQTYGFEALLKALDQIGRAGTAEAALAAGANRSLEAIDAGFRDYLKRRLANYENLPPIRPSERPLVGLLDGGTSVTLARQGWTEQGGVFNEAMRRANEAWQREDWAQAGAELERAHEAFPDYMGADAPLRRLIGLYEKTGQREKLKEALKREIDWNQADYPACQRLTALLVEEEAWEEAVRAADWALGIDPFDLGMRQTLLSGQLRIGDAEGAMRTLGQLAQLDKARAADYLLRRVQLLVEAERWEPARREAVALLERTPHFWEAQELLLRIDERRTEERQ